MDKQILKIKIGDNEFEAEGPQDIIQAQFEAFREMVMSVPIVARESASDAGHDKEMGEDNAEPENYSPDDQLDKIMKIDGRVVSLTVAVESIDDAVLLLMYGQKVYRSNDSVTGGQIMGGLTVTGQGVRRIDRFVEKLRKEGHCLILGQKRAKRYRLTNKGFAKAQEIARDRLAIVA